MIFIHHLEGFFSRKWLVGRLGEMEREWKNLLINSKTKRGLFWDKCFEYPHPYVIWKMQYLPHISSPSSWNWKISRQKVVVTFKMNIWSTHSPMLPWKMQFLLHIFYPSSWIWKFLTRTAFLKLRDPPYLDPGPSSPGPQTLDPPSTWTLDLRSPFQIPHQTDRHLIQVISPSMRSQLLANMPDGCCQQLTKEMYLAIHLSWLLWSNVLTLGHLRIYYKEAAMFPKFWGWKSVPHQIVSPM